MVKTVEAIAKAIEGGVKYLTLLLKTSHVRRLRKAVDFGEYYIIEDEKLKHLKDEGEIKQVKARKALAKKRFFKYNQG